MRNAGRLGTPVAVAVLLTAALGIRGYFFLISSTHVPPTSDEALAFLGAQAILEGARPLLFWGTPYQFPLESYVMAPITPYLPMNAYGARLPLAVLACLAVPGFALLTKLLFPSGRRWPTLLLVLFPSAYVVTLQSAYFIPQHTMTLTFSWVLPLLAVQALRGQHRAWWVVGCGLLSGIALATHLLSLPLVAGVAIVVCCGKSLGNSIRNTLAFFLPLALGFMPYLVTMHEARAMAATVTATHPLGTALQRLFSKDLHNTLSTIIGITGCSFPDFHPWRGHYPVFIAPVLMLFGCILLLATLKSLLRLSASVRHRGWPTFDVEDIFVLTVWACLCAFALSARGESGEYRYLLPVAWALPFVLGAAYTLPPRALRWGVGLCAVLLVAINLSHTKAIIDSWRTPGFAQRTPDLHDLSGVFSYLRSRDITHCYASFWFSYRLTFESGGQVLCDQPQNERFLGWPLPFKDEVDASSNAAYVLTNTWSSRLRAQHFQAMLQFHRISFSLEQIGPFYVFHNFGYRDVAESRRLTADELELSASHAPELLPRLLDGMQESVWSSNEAQSDRMWIVAKLNQAKLLHRLRVFFDPAPGGLPIAPRYRVELSEDGENWDLIRADIEPLADRVLMRPTHPILHSGARQDISFAPQRARYLRLSVEGSHTPATTAQAPWKLAELELNESLPQAE